MSADGFMVYYGFRWEIDIFDRQLVGLLETGEEPRIKAALQNGLQSWWGETTDETKYSLLIGTELGAFGWEGMHNLEISDSRLEGLMVETRTRFLAAGFEQVPSLQLQFRPDY